MTTTLGTTTCATCHSTTREVHLQPSTSSSPHFGTSSSRTSPHQHHQDGLMCSRSKRQQPQGRFRHEDAGFRLQRRRRQHDFRGALPRKPQVHCLSQVADQHRQSTRSKACTILPQLDADLCRQGRVIPLEAVARGAGDLVCQVPTKQEAWPWSAGSASSSFSRRCTARRSRGRGTGSWSLCWPHCRGRRALWCLKNECVL